MSNADIGMPPTRMFDYQIPDYEPFLGYLGMTGSTGGCDQNNIIRWVKVEDLTGICTLPPATATRTITDMNRHDNLLLYTEGDPYGVSIALSGIRVDNTEDTDCSAPPTEVTITETLPAGWTATNISDGGTFANGQVTWVLKDAQIVPHALTYQTMGAGAEFDYTFIGTIQETNVPGQTAYGISGDNQVLSPFTKDGYIRSWNILGPLAFANPAPPDQTLSCTGGTGGDQLAQPDPGDPTIYPPVDWIVNADASVTEDTILPFPNIITKPAYGGDGVGSGARAAGLTVGALEFGAVATDRFPVWKQVLSPTADVDLNSAGVFGVEYDDCVTLACVYVNNNTPDPIVTGIGEGSDDGMVVQVNDVVPSVVGAQCRGWGTGDLEVIPDITLNPGENRILVKVTDGGGGYGFRLRFVDPNDPTQVLLPPTITVSFESATDPAKWAFRKIDRASFNPGDAIGVSIAITSPVASDTTVTETFPAGAAITDISDGGTVNGNTIGWTLSGITTKTLTYKIAPGSCVGNFSLGGSFVIGSDEILILGDTALSLVVRNDALSNWTSQDIGTAIGAAQILGAHDIDLYSPGQGIRLTKNDECRYVSIPESGDFSISARIDCVVDAGTTGYGGLMVRNTADVGSACAFVGVSNSASGTLSIKASVRRNTNVLISSGLAVTDKTVDSLPVWVQIARTGTKLYLQRSSNGTNWTDLIAGGIDIVASNPSATGQIVLQTNVLAGLMMASGAVGSSTEMTFGSVSGPSFGEVVTPPAKPTGLTAAGGDKQVTLDWADNADAVQGYNVYRNGTKANAAPVTVSSYTDTGLTNGTQYCYTVRAVGPGGESADSDSKCATPNPVTGAWKRCDANGDGKQDLSDGVLILNYLFVGVAKAPSCLEALNCNGDTKMDVTDAVALLGYLFQGEKKPPEPYGACGVLHTGFAGGAGTGDPCLYDDTVTKCKP